MTVTEMIRKWSIELVEQNGNPAIKLHGKATSKQVAELKAAKTQIIEELQRRAQEKAAREAQQRAELAQELEDLKSGAKAIKPEYHDGEYLSGYEVYGQEAGLLEGLGLVKYISGWGYHVEQKVIDALGAEFTYQQAVEYARPAVKAKAEAQAKKEVERQVKFAEARTTGQPVLLRKWTTGCCDRREECDMDMHYEYADPDGTVRYEWSHTW